MLCPPGSQSYTTAGTYQFTTPVNCGTSITYTITVIGAGGGGAADDYYCQGAPNYDGLGGGGGGGGGYATGSISGFSSGTTFSITVGSGGSAGSVSGGYPYTCTAGGNGGNSAVTYSTFAITATGGQGGLLWAPTLGYDGGAQGAYSCSGISCTGANGIGQEDSSGCWTNSTYNYCYGGNGGCSGQYGAGAQGACNGPAGQGGLGEYSWPGTKTGYVNFGPAQSGYNYGGGGGGGGGNIIIATALPASSTDPGAPGAGGEVTISWN